MTDLGAMFTQHFDAARAAVARGDQEAAAESLRAAVVVARSNPALKRELASALLHLGKLSEKLGRGGEAEQLLTEALSISERLFGMEHAALGPLLNELSRLHIQQSHHARAEAALERLLGIVRAKGEEHPEVATALAGLAVVKRRVGDDAAAEALFRDALRIREKVLAANQIDTVVTLEQLSETCEARGRLHEALTLLQRALPTREAAVGAGHATVHAARTRVTALELQIAVEADKAAAEAKKAGRPASPTPAWIKALPLAADAPPPPEPAPSTDPNELVFLYKPEPRVRRPSAPAASPKEKRAPEPRHTASMSSYIDTPMELLPVGEMVISPPESVRASGSNGRVSGAVHRDSIRAEVAHDDFAGVDARHTGGFAPKLAESHERSHKNRTVIYASAGAAAAVVIAVVGLMLRPGAGGGSDSPAAEPTEQTTAAIVAPVVTPAGTPTRTAALNAARADSARSVSVTPTASATRAVETAAAAPEPVAPVVRFRVGRVDVPSIAMTNVDSLVRSGNRRGADNDVIGSGVGVPRLAKDDDGLASAPMIVGRPPVPHFPDALRSTQPEGEVLVRFKVNESGSVDVESMTVMKSDHPLFTTAVRNVLPQFKFQPARSRAPESKPVAVWVSLPFKFTAKK